MGSCLYDKQYLADLKNLKAVPKKFDPSEIHRPGKVYPDPPRRFRTGMIDQAGGQAQMQQQQQPVAGPSKPQPNHAQQNQANRNNNTAANNGVRPAVHNNNANNQNRGGQPVQKAAQNVGNANHNNANNRQNVKQQPVKQEPAPIPAEEEMMEGNDDDKPLLPPDADDGEGFDHEMDAMLEDLDEAEVTALENGHVDDSGFDEGVSIVAAKPGMPNAGSRRGSMQDNQPRMQANNAGKMPQNARAPSAPVGGNAGQNANVRNNQQQVSRDCGPKNASDSCLPPCCTGLPSAASSRTFERTQSRKLASRKQSSERCGGCQANSRSSVSEPYILPEISELIVEILNCSNADDGLAAPHADEREISPIEMARILQVQQDKQEVQERVAKKREEAMAKRAQKAASGQGQGH